jgi:histone deacetylase complex regulatory component SIN3
MLSNTPAQMANVDGPGAHGDFGGAHDKYQYAFSLKDTDVFEDVQNVLLWHSNRMLTGQEQEDFSHFVNHVIPTLFHFSKDKETNGDAEVTDNDRIKEDMDLDHPTVPRQPGAPSPTGRKNRKKRATYQFYANNNWYAFYRLFGSLYHRLIKMKDRSAALAREPPVVQGLNKVAVSLHYQDEAQARMLDEKFQQDRYRLLLRLIEAFFSQLYEDQTKYQKASNDFEEATRELFGIHAYLMFTLDKLAQTLAKQIQTILADYESQELLKLYQEDCKLDRWSPRQESKYCLSVESMLRDQHLYRIQYVRLYLFRLIPEACS